MSLSELGHSRGYYEEKDVEKKDPDSKKSSFILTFQSNSFFLFAWGLLFWLHLRSFQVFRLVFVFPSTLRPLSSLELYQPDKTLFLYLDCGNGLHGTGLKYIDAKLPEE